jgi:ABC-type uncharacterized transport system involved in gliding motility auxiliary subunit
MKEQLKKADVLGLVLIASAVIAYLIRKNWTNLQTGVLVAGAALVVVSLILKAGDIRAGLGRRSTKFGINSGVSVLLFIGVLALVNYLGDQHQKRFDVTTEHMHSLGDESVKVLGELKDDVHVKAFYPLPEERDLRELLQLYSQQNGRVSVEFIDPDKQPTLAQQYQVTVYGRMVNPLTREQRAFGTLILDKGKGRVERIEKQDTVTEEDVTNALMKLVKGEEKTIYFVEGHGEKAIDGTDRNGYQVANSALGKDGYKVKTLSLVREEKVPADASAVAMVGPATEPFPQEMEKLDAYLNTGGSVLLMLDPPPGGASLKDFTQKWSVAVGDNRVIDLTGMGQLLGEGPASPLVTRYGEHKIVERFNLMTYFPLARSVAPAKEPAAGVSAQPLIETADQSWGWHDLTSNEVRSFDPKLDLKGPVPIATVVTKDVADGKKARMIVFGDSDFAKNANFSNQGNGNLFLNTVKWLARDENFISIKTKSPMDRPLTITESGGRTVGILLVFLFPGAVLLSGILVWARRRR